MVIVCYSTLCEYCKSNDNFVGSCSSYLSLPVTRRFDFGKISKLCINCLKKCHLVPRSSSKSRCRTCRVSHQTSLHNSNTQSTNNPSISWHQFHSPSTSSFQRASSSLQQSFSPANQSASSTYTITASTYLTQFSSFVTRVCRINLLPTVFIFIKNSFNTLHPHRVLLDYYSDVNLITQENINRLRLKQNRTTQEISGISNIRT